MTKWILIIFTTFNGSSNSIDSVEFDNLYACKEARIVVEQTLAQRSNLDVTARCVSKELPRELYSGGS